MWQPVLMIDGFILSILGLTMFLPAGWDIYVSHSFESPFLISACFTLFIGACLFLANMAKIDKMSLRQGYLVTVLCWVSVSVFAAFPFFLSGGVFDWPSALFESVSGVTGTGATVLDDIESQPRTILLWRSMLNGLGGIGIVIFAVAMLPFLGIGGMQIFQRENVDATDKLMPKFVDIAKGIILVYAALVVLCALLLYWSGMSRFDAVNHALSAVATSGFSTRNNSIAFYDSVQIEMILSVFMLLGALPMTVYLLLIRNHEIDTFRAGQVRYFLKHVLFCVVAAALLLSWYNGLNFFKALRLSVFNVISVMTTTGLASSDYIGWGVWAAVFFSLLSLHGGCIGSTTGSIKVLRWQILGAYFRKVMGASIEPNRVIPVRSGDVSVDSGVVNSVFFYILVFLLSIAAMALTLNLMGYDLAMSVSTAVAIITNTGPGVTLATGPMGNFAFLTPVAKYILIFGMLLGRLEIVTVLVVMTKSFWKR
jgi:trk system potassium uptake protein TrkH